MLLHRRLLRRNICPMAKHMSKTVRHRLEGRTAAAKSWYMPRRKVFNQMATSHPVMVVVLFLGRRIVLFDHEVNWHAVQLLEHKRSVDHRILG